MRIPEPLWRLASRLAVAYGVCRTASELGLNYYGLKRRVEEQASPSASFGWAVPAFGTAGIDASDLAGECILEFENWPWVPSCGSILKGGAIPDLVALGRSFLECRVMIQTRRR